MQEDMRILSMKFIEETETRRVVHNEDKYKLMQINC